MGNEHEEMQVLAIDDWWMYHTLDDRKGEGDDEPKNLQANGTTEGSREGRHDKLTSLPKQ